MKVVVSRSCSNDPFKCTVQVLENGFQEAIIACEFDNRQQTLDNCEPNSWYKILVLNSITIDINGKTIVCQVSGGDESNVVEQKGTNADVNRQYKTIVTRANPFNEGNVVKKNGEKRKYFPVQGAFTQVFETLQEIVTERKKSNDREGFSEDMIRVLQHYVLPAVEFDSTDLPQLNSALHLITKDILPKKDHEIQTKQKEYEKLEESVASLKEQIIERLYGSRENSRGIEIDDKCADIVLEDLQKEHHKRQFDFLRAVTRFNILCLQKENILKGIEQPIVAKEEIRETIEQNIRKSYLTSSRTSTGCELKVLSQLYSIKAESFDSKIQQSSNVMEQKHSDFQQILVAVTLLKDHIRVRNQKKKSRSSPLKILKSTSKATVIMSKEKMDQYMIYHPHRMELKEKIQLLVSEKIALLLIREAVTEEIMAQEERLERMEQEKQEFLKNSIKSKFRLIENNMKRILHNSEHVITKLHYKLIGKVLSYCEIIKINCEPERKDNVHLRQEGNNLGQAVSSSQNLEKLFDLNSESCNNLKILKTHINKQCNAITTEFVNSRRDCADNDSMLAAEVYFSLLFHEIGPILHSTYELVYSKVVDFFIQNKQHYSRTELAISPELAEVILLTPQNENLVTQFENKDSSLQTFKAKPENLSKFRKTCKFASTLEESQFLTSEEKLRIRSNLSHGLETSHFNKKATDLNHSSSKSSFRVNRMSFVQNLIKNSQERDEIKKDNEEDICNSEPNAATSCQTESKNEIHQSDLQTGRENNISSHEEEENSKKCDESKVNLKPVPETPVTIETDFKLKDEHLFDEVKAALQDMGSNKYTSPIEMAKKSYQAIYEMYNIAKFLLPRIIKASDDSLPRSKSQGSASIFIEDLQANGINMDLINELLIILIFNLESEALKSLYICVEIITNFNENDDRAIGKNQKFASQFKLVWCTLEEKMRIKLIES